MYPYMTLNDDTEITHSEMKADGRVKVYIETPDEKNGFRHATCWLPDYRWEDIFAYSDMELTYFKKIIRNNAHFTRGRNYECLKFLESVHLLCIFGQLKIIR